MTDVMLVDGLNVFMRHFAANPTTSGNGESVGGIVGFLRGLRHLVNRFGPSKVIVVWESGGSQRRRALDPNYKNGRRPVKLNRWYDDDEMPSTIQNRNGQLNLLIKFLRFGPIQQVYVSDCEADDVLGYLCNYELTDSEIILVSSDRDYYQLISDRVKIWSPGQKKIIDKEEVLKKFSINVKNFCAARCFCGDSADGINGAKGVGFKTLAKRFPELSTEEECSVTEIVNSASLQMSGSKLKIYSSIVEHAECAKLNWKLMYLGTNNLSATQIQHIQFQASEPPPKSKKLDFMRLLLKNQITNFDVNSYFMSLNFINSKNTH